MQEVKFKDAIRYYDPIVKRLQESLVDITAIVLANLCVSYIMTSQVSYSLFSLSSLYFCL